jgi:nucleoside phosphorylase
MTHKIFIYTALPCEAKPLIAHFKLKKRLNVRPFAVYEKDAVCLTVTGVGKNAMAAGVAYTQALFNTVENPVLINIGIAGHRDHPLGSLFLIDKITDADSHKSHYPPLISKAPCASGAIQTAAKPQLDYAHDQLCDMEASAFYETATRFSTGELVQCLKIISDNQHSPATLIHAQQVSVLIADQLEAIEIVINQLVALADVLITPDNALFKQLIQKYHFTVNGQMQLKAQLARWAVLSDYQALPIDEIQLNSGKELLGWLEEQLKCY